MREKQKLIRYGVAFIENYARADHMIHEQDCRLNFPNALSRGWVSDSADLTPVCRCNVAIVNVACTSVCVSMDSPKEVNLSCGNCVL